MMRFISTITIVSCMSFLAMGSSALAAGDVLSFSYSNLDGSFNSTSSLFTASDDNDSIGSASRLVPVVGDAFFQGTSMDAGFPGMAAFDLQLNMTSLTTTNASSTGQITLTDTNGDKFVGDVTGAWNNVSNGVAAVFAGTLNNFVPVNVSGDNTFDGNTGPGFSTLFSQMLPFSGATVTLQFGNWFTNTNGQPTGFSNASTSATGVVVPEPATLAMLGFGGLALIARRRKK